MLDQVTASHILNACPPRPPLSLTLLPNDIPLPPSVNYVHFFDTDTLRDAQMTLLQECININKVNYSGIMTHPVIITASFGIHLNPIQHNGSQFKSSILLNSLIMHIDPIRNILAIHTGHIVLTFILSIAGFCKKTIQDCQESWG
jgi:hypothetical protein